MISEGIIHHTTILAVRRNNSLVFGGDGQVTQGNTILKSHASKVRQLVSGQGIAGFAGSAADGLTLLDRLEDRLKETKGRLLKAAVLLAREWRTDRVLRRLEAILLAGDKERILILNGAGDVIEAEEDSAAIGSGGPFAIAAAKALMRNSDMDARSIVEKSMAIASEICIYTNQELVIEELKV